jgi:hypothetical protein
MSLQNLKETQGLKELVTEYEGKILSINTLKTSVLNILTELKNHTDYGSIATSDEKTNIESNETSLKNLNLI